MIATHTTLISIDEYNILFVCMYIIDSSCVASEKFRPGAVKTDLNNVYLFKVLHGHVSSICGVAELVVLFYFYLFVLTTDVTFHP